MEPARLAYSGSKDNPSHRGARRGFGAELDSKPQRGIQICQYISRGN